jgi:DNA-binding transcriptional regulator YiaG
MPSFMMEIDAAQRSPLDQLAVDYLLLRSGYSIDFCRRVVGVSEGDDAVARRLGVAVSTVRGWREVGRRANGWSC